MVKTNSLRNIQWLIEGSQGKREEENEVKTRSVEVKKKIVIFKVKKAKNSRLVVYFTLWKLIFAKTCSSLKFFAQSRKEEALDDAMNKGLLPRLIMTVFAACAM